jgi:hypothetical protein
VTALLGYLMNDLLREYVASGEFTKRGRWCAALREAAMFYVPAAAIGLGCARPPARARPLRDLPAPLRIRHSPPVRLPFPACPPACLSSPCRAWTVAARFVVYMMATQGLKEGLLNTKVLGRALINIIGLFILVAFLGYGLVEVPRQLWNKGDVHGQLRYLQFKVAVQSEELQSARRKVRGRAAAARPPPPACSARAIRAVHAPPTTADVETPPRAWRGAARSSKRRWSWCTARTRSSRRRRGARPRRATRGCRRI